jgi:flagellum-specific ATP synthase
VAELLHDLLEIARGTSLRRVTGRVVEITGLTLVADGLPLPIGSMCRVEPESGNAIMAQVVGFRSSRTVLMTLSEPLGIRSGDPVRSTAGLQHVPVGQGMLGAILDGLGRPIGGTTSFTVESRYPVHRIAPPALSRRPIRNVLATGIRSIDALHTLGCGQRMGIFAGTGVGKSVLLGMITRNTSADVVVLALVGERGREVGDVIRKDLGEEGLKRCVLVVSTSDESPVLRVRAGFVATTVAEYFRDLGAHVLLLMDSATRIAMAQRQIGLAAGEPPATKGYPPSVFSLLPQLLERSGQTPEGSITGLYSVLVEGDDINEPISDAMRGILDGHIWLSRDLANRAHYPAVSVLESISRVMSDVVDEEMLRAARDVRRVLATWRDIEDLVTIGAHTPGLNTEHDLAVEMKPVVDEFLRQTITECALWASVREDVLALADRIRASRQALEGRRGAEPGATDTGMRKSAPRSERQEEPAEAAAGA